MGLHAQKHVTLMGFKNISWLENIASIQSHLLKKDEAITKKGEYFPFLY
jgi:hypothetical protein